MPLGALIHIFLQELKRILVDNLPSGFLSSIPRGIGRNKEYLSIAVDFALDVNADRVLVGFLPEFVKGWVLPLPLDC